jgi:hypothetical protein
MRWSWVSLWLGLVPGAAAAVDLIGSDPKVRFAEVGLWPAFSRAIRGTGITFVGGEASGFVFLFIGAEGSIVSNTNSTFIPIKKSFTTTSGSCPPRFYLIEATHP